MDEEKLQAKIDMIERQDTADSLAKPAATHLEKQKGGWDRKGVPLIMTTNLPSRSSMGSSIRSSVGSDSLTLPHIKPVDPFTPI